MSLCCDYDNGKYYILLFYYLLKPFNVLAIFLTIAKKPRYETNETEWKSTVSTLDGWILTACFILYSLCLLDYYYWLVIIFDSVHIVVALSPHISLVPDNVPSSRLTWILQYLYCICYQCTIVICIGQIKKHTEPVFFPNRASFTLAYKNMEVYYSSSEPISHFRIYQYTRNITPKKIFRPKICLIRNKYVFLLETCFKSFF